MEKTKDIPPPMPAGLSGTHSISIEDPFGTSLDTFLICADTLIWKSKNRRGEKNLVVQIRDSVYSQNSAGVFTPVSAYQDILGRRRCYGTYDSEMILDYECTRYRCGDQFRTYEFWIGENLFFPKSYQYGRVFTRVFSADGTLFKYPYSGYDYTLTSIREEDCDCQAVLEDVGY